MLQRRSYRGGLADGDKKRVRLVATILFSAALAVAAGKMAAAQVSVPGFWESPQQIAKPDLAALSRLRFLTSTDFFPFNFRDGDGRLTGFHVDLARAICRELEVIERCQIQALPFEELQTALEEGAGEAIIAGLAITSDSRENVLFSRSYLQLPARFVARRESDLTGPVHQAIAGHRVGVLAQTAHEQMLRELFSTAQVVAYEQEEELRQDLASGKIGVAFGDGMRLSFWLAGEDGRACCTFAGGPYLAPEYLGQGLAIAVGRDRPQLATAMNHALQQIEANGTFAELYLRYFPVGFY